MSSVSEWKWTYGEKYEKSMRVPKEKKREMLVAATKETENFAVQQALFSEEDAWNLEQNIQQRQGMREPNRRESNYTRMSEREMIGQIGMNPFHSNNNYMNDLQVQDEFLKPISTTFEREKEKEKEKEVGVGSN